MKTLEYKGYKTIVKYSEEDGVFHGKLENITDLVTYEADTIEKTAPAFHEAVDDYLGICKENGISPKK